MFLKILQYSQENSCVRVRDSPTTLLKRLQHRYFSENIAKFSRTIFFNRTSRVTASTFFQLFALGIFSSQKAGKLFGEKTQNHLFHVLLYFFFIRTLCKREKGTPSLLQKDKRGSIKSHISDIVMFQSCFET